MFLQHFSCSQTSTRVSITRQKHGTCFLFLKYCYVELFRPICGCIKQFRTVESSHSWKKIVWPFLNFDWAYTTLFQTQWKPSYRVWILRTVSKLNMKTGTHSRHYSLINRPIFCEIRKTRTIRTSWVISDRNGTSWNIFDHSTNSVEEVNLRRYKSAWIGEKHIFGKFCYYLTFIHCTNSDFLIGWFT